MTPRLIPYTLLTAALLQGCNDNQTCIDATPNIANYQAISEHIHDPTMEKQGSYYYLYSSSPLGAFYSSLDKVNWDYRGNVFSEIPVWLTDSIENLDHIGAPDISFYNGQYVYFYQSHKSGTCNAATGLLTNTTLDPEAPDYKWVDHGEILRSKPLLGEIICGGYGRHYNAIDAMFYVDDDQKPWLVFGSTMGDISLAGVIPQIYMGGIHLLELDPKTLKPIDPSKMITLASRPITDISTGEFVVEAPFIQYKNGFYYLYMSYNSCCKGPDTKYEIRVGRSKDIQGPYVDSYGRLLNEGGGTKLLDKDGEQIGTGHNDVFTEDNQDWLVHHAYDSTNNYKPTLQLRQIEWEQGWPKVCNKWVDK
ncbi:arabinan endo-1,5-alpha-L-arabinosidase [Grimontia kaedaensis]|uniref:Arabinan endo-1,5-alpha-L-arabinosidase n=1 Tax=Grimontia kaedaensis TaxID=2872157 RepID=A0ABY4X2H6_9GAMM|nr:MULTISPECIES: arabinan endo-1,5-alpha-L-arabinosidase [Grimontia]USH05411.1 arabinan endo-1,5-alpha-L-arabinosidase [Grimontia kaedaensis]